MLFSTKKIVCITFTETELSVSEFEKRDPEPKLISAGSVSLQSGVVVRGEVKKSAEFIEALRDVLRAAQPSEIKTKEMIVVMPEQQVYLTLLRFTESKSPGEILEEAPREALASIPLDYTQIYCDFYQLPVEKGRPNEVVYAACNKAVANEYIRILSELKLKPASFVTEPDAFLSSVGNRADDGLKLLFVANKQRSYWIIGNGTIVKKVVPSALQFSSSAVSFETISAEANTVLSAYQSAEGCSKTPSGIFIWDEAAQIEKKINEKVAGVQVMFVSPRLPHEITLLQRAYGAAKKFFDKKYFGKNIDLLPVRFKEQLALLQLNTFLTVLSIMFIFAAGGAMSVYSFAWSEMYFDFQRAEKEASGVAKNVVTSRFEEIKEKTRRFNEEVNALIQIQSKIISYDSLWKNVGNALVSSGINSTYVEFNSEDLTVGLRGAAKTRNDLKVLEGKIESLPETFKLISPLSNLDKTKDISYTLTIELDPKKIPYLVTDN